MGNMVTLPQLEEQKAALLARVDGWSSDRLAYRPAPNDWSALEVFEHLAKTEAGITATARSGLRNPQPVGIADRAKFLLLESLFKTSARVKVPPAASAVLPSAGLSLPEVLDRWTAARSEIASLIREAPQGDPPRGVFRHPVSGWMTVPQVMRFFSVHITHHTYQLERIQAALLPLRPLS